jgi:pyruvate/2-oxoglutarate dehydrogenase complex dihydrolipoamide acyltransferase (E2) component
MASRRHPIHLPDLGLEGSPVRASVWLSALGSDVVAGDRVLEVVAGSISVDLPAPATGRLVKKTVDEEDVLEVGQILGIIEETTEET